MVKKIIFIFLLTCFAKSNVFAETIDINNDEIKNTTGSYYPDKANKECKMQKNNNNISFFTKG